MKLKFSPLGDEHILINFGDKISPRTLSKVLSAGAALKPHVLEVKSAYSTLMVRYNALQYEYNSYVKKINSIIKNVDINSRHDAKVHKIMTQYGGEWGQDLSRVARHNNLTEKQVVKIHTQNDYLVYMIGFLPGFCYLGGLDNNIATPRLDVPRKQIAKGSVGIAGQQTGVYPIQSPGGWNIIGRTEYDFFVNENPPCKIMPGDYIRFVEV